MADEQDPIEAQDPAEAETSDDIEQPTEVARRRSLREQAHAPSDTVGTGSYAAVACSVIALMATALLVAGLLLVRWVT